ncbi:spermatogenesis-associated protein 5-like protein 1 isoform X1 [Protopterus annectens]|uniref:spermatogenesis-associated protein 5-like protein 1 isoform X1 n=1 Tax=Protopterus annectens TaxID=7888 RepID=UPI001CF9C3BC|nr:spermatogenesis-associated protein 5-like protein 1 isoform X1 [Protopterus annectens]
MSFQLRVLPLHPEDLGTQRCRIGPSIFKSLNLKLGSLVQLSAFGGSCLCTVWPRKDLTDGFLQFDLKCSTQELIRKTWKNHTVHQDQIKRLSYVKVEHVTVNVVVRSTEAKNTLSPSLLQELVSDLLRNVYVCGNSLVSVDDTVTPIIFLKILNLTPFTNEAGLITSKSTIQIKDIVTLQWYDQISLNSEQIPLGGLEEVTTAVKEILTLPFQYPQSLKKLSLSSPRGVLLIGPPGVGKTLLVKAVAREVAAYVLGISGPAIHGSRPGESEESLRNLFQQAGELSNEGPCILFIDEIDSLCPKRGNSTGGPENRIVAQLLTLMDGINSEDKVVILATTNRPDTLDPALRRPGRFDREVVIGAPTLKQRKAILEALTCNMPLSKDVDIVHLAEMTPGFVGADLSALCREAALRAVLHGSEGSIDKIQMADFCDASKKIQPSCLRGSIGLKEVSAVAWEHIGGLDEVKLKLKQSIEWPMKFPEAFVRMGLSRPKGVLLCGPPGCAKTTLVKAAANSCYCTFLSVSGADLFSPYVGDSEKILSEVFRQARASAPSLLFLDEIESIIGSRSTRSNNSGVQERVLSVLLNELDGIGLKITERRGARHKRHCHDDDSEQDEGSLKLDFLEVCNKDVMVVAATNLPGMLDDALLRPGRLDKIIHVPPPDKQARYAILKIYTEKFSLDGNINLEELAEQTSQFSGADLENLCREAALLALQEGGLNATAVTRDHFVKCLQTYRPSLAAVIESSVSRNKEITL